MSKEPQLSRFGVPSAGIASALVVEYLYAAPYEYEAVLADEFPSLTVGRQLDAWEGK